MKRAKKIFIWLPSLHSIQRFVVVYFSFEKFSFALVCGIQVLRWQHQQFFLSLFIDFYPIFSLNEKHQKEVEGKTDFPCTKHCQQYSNDISIEIFT